MSQQHTTTTNQLSTVIDVLQLGKKTGVLTVERGEGDHREEGVMTFLNGKVVYANVGLLTGKEAATKLFSWRACRFSFIPLQPEEIPRSGPSKSSRTEEISTTPESLPRFSQKDPQTEPMLQDPMSRRPLLTIYRGSVYDILQMFDRQGFSRTHRHLFLLIDERRSIRELATLIKRTPEETMTLLTDLQRVGLISL